MPSAATPLLTRPATELAELVRSGQLRSRELVEAALERIAEMHALNAFTLVDAEGALAAADAITPGDPRPFAGIPMAIKELNAVAGQPLTMGSDLYGDYRPDMDAYVVRRLKDAGFVLIGRTAAPEFGILPVTESRRLARHAIPGILTTPPADHRAARAQPWRRAFCRWRTARMAPDRFVCQRHAVGWWA